MNVQHLLQSYPSDAVMEAVYLGGRLFSRPLSWDEFIRQLDANVKSKTRAQALEIVQLVIREAEQELRKPFSQMSFEEKRPYIEKLDGVRSELVRQSDIDARETDESLEELRGISIGTRRAE